MESGWKLEILKHRAGGNAMVARKGELFTPSMTYPFPPNKP